LIVGSYFGLESVVQLLLEKEADVKAADDFRMTALYQAASNGHEAVVQLLLEKGADVEEVDGLKSITALHMAAVDEHEVVM
jgi:ankyrin repeat protein